MQIGNLITLKANMNYTGTKSMEVGVRVEAEDLATGVITHCASAYLVFVALSDSGSPIAGAAARPAHRPAAPLVRAGEGSAATSGSPSASRPTDGPQPGGSPSAGQTARRHPALQPQHLAQRLVSHVELVLGRLARREEALHLDAGQPQGGGERVVLMARHPAEDLDRRAE